MAKLSSKRKVLLIGWDAADWGFLEPLMDAGDMPNLSSLVAGGTSGKLRTLDPMLSPTLWTSIATGKRPGDHGITAFTQLTKDGKLVHPILNTGRKVKAIWNILNQTGHTSNVVSWWPSHPAEPIRGVMVSNFYQRVEGTLEEPKSMMKNTVTPVELSPVLEQLRLHHHQLTRNHLLPFIPNLDQIDHYRDNRLTVLAKITAQTANVQSATTYLLEHSEWDFTAVYFDGIDHYAHAFMDFHPPYRDHINRKDFEVYRHVMEGACKFHDMMLGRLMELVDEETTIVLVSDHGFYSDHRRPVATANEPTGIQYEHSPYGIFIANGPGIRAGATVTGAGLLDVTPTLLQLFGLSVGRDMPGKVLHACFEDSTPTKYVNSWESITGEDGQHQQGFSYTYDARLEELSQLAELGYIDPVSEDTINMSAKHRRESEYNRARSLLHERKYQAAIEQLLSLCAEDPEAHHYHLWLVNAYVECGQDKLAREALESLRSKTARNTPELDLLEGMVCMAEGRYKRAISLFQKLDYETSDLPQLHLRIGKAYLQLNKLEDAERSIKRELRTDPDSASAHELLARTYHGQLKYDDAVSSFLQSIGLEYQSPSAHLGLADSLRELGKYQEAATAYETALTLAPGANVIRQRLIALYRNRLNKPDLADSHLLALEGKIRGTITIVSGLPRSGTSLLMQMLEAGGLDIFQDDHRPADDSNPRGYYEHAAVKALDKDKSFLPRAIDKAVKVITQLVPALPLNYRYRIVHIQRDVHEVVASQDKMLERLGTPRKGDSYPFHLVDSYQAATHKLVTWAEDLPQVKLLNVQFADVLANPFELAIYLNDFLGGHLNVPAMAQVIDQKLYRSRGTAVT